ncbi:hypothetical protein METBIDRAFT_79107 [Metschnikowia bicuspidata var. bicuspidata NRRL YB-4993]|uniref:HAD-like protein n=1 Tax=Metschnikowia bicuspidata var. bicuspidata NRRL YB-4993 TaxID=869754 RepID=A0A1A0H754_9ASCO|nr:hypothetical protein METBIDRAFT_79107 [Metschnikowia bicuspidata var. bicuspidata NRRL YB-4993]OBA19733.1 hypothetical protein METBIDRAFT_79107 [Metschnikowia bicuspidata var. bicuspidata NRRL YB-4993]
MSGRIFITDWDETATMADTTALIALAASRRDRDAVPPFTHFSQIYLDAYLAYIAQEASGCGRRDSVIAEEKFQQGMRAVEYTSIRALEETGYFKGFPIGKLRDLVPKVELRPGFVDFVKSAGCPVYVLSVNWCRRLIEWVLEFHGVRHVTVLANDFEVDAEDITTGKFDRRCDIRTGYDKAMELARIRSLHPALNLFYFGDSSGDVLPILKADYGGVITGGRARTVLGLLAEVYMLESDFRSPDSVGLYSQVPKVFEATWHELAAAWHR